MDQIIVRRMKLFFPWQYDQEEVWLEEMSRQGLHLVHVHMPVTYDFTRGPAGDYVYRLDFQDARVKKNKETYLGLFKDSGWEHLGQMSGWQYFRKPLQPGQQAEIFTDRETKIQKYRRFLSWFWVSYPFSLVIFVLLLDNHFWLDMGILLAFSALWLVITLKVWQRIRQLQSP